MEEWRPIEGFDGYEVSNMGQVRSLDRYCVDSWGRKYLQRGKTIKLSTSLSKGNYLQVFATIYENRKPHRLLVHRLVAKAFIPNPNDLPQINHKDENSTNNCVENLEWCDAKYNVNYGTGIARRSITNRKAISVYDANHNYIETLPGGQDVSQKYKISPGHISTSCHNHTMAKGFYFEFA